MENKVIYNDFFNFIKTYDVFILLETHISEEKVERFKKFFEGYETFWKPALKNSRFGRGIAGYVYGIKKDLRKKNISYELSIKEEIELIKIKSSNKTINIIPLYLRAATWNEDFEDVRRFLINEDVENMILMGDLNIRIGNLQQPMDEFTKSTFRSGFDTRKSRDLKINTKGKRFLELCQDFGLHILNGCTKGDELGSLTFISGVGESVNDICAAAYDILDSIESFIVNDKIWSDHMPITLTINVNGRSLEQQMNLLPKLKWDERKCDNYKEKLNQQLTLYKQRTDALTLQDLVEVINVSNPTTYNNKILFTKENKWFNFKCYNAREKSFNDLQLFRQTPSKTNKEEYVAENKKYKLICEKSKIDYYKGIETQINSVKNNKDWWNLMIEIKNKKLQPKSEITTQEFKQYFSELLNPPLTSNDVMYAAMLKSDNDLDMPITRTEIKEVLAKTKYNKAPGEDRVSYEFFKNATEMFIEELAKSYNIIFESAKLDEKFTTSIIFPIYKKGDKEIVSNYRGISFMNTIAKIFMGILNKRLTLWLNKHNILTEYQAGFREGYSTVDNLYTLAAIAHLKFKENKKLYAFFVDFRAAFDKVSRKALIYKLYSTGVSTKMIKMIETIYSHTKFRVWNGEEVSDEFITESGVKQGCLLSPTLFSIYLNDLHSFIEGGVNVGYTNIRLLMYADDIVILADDIVTMQNMIKQLERYCVMWNLEVNLSKSQMMIFRSGGKTSKYEKWVFNGDPIIVTNEYTYLGVTLSPKMSFRKHLEKRTLSAKNAINSTWQDFLAKRDIGLNAKWNLFKAVCRAIQSYGAQIWGFSLFEDVDKLQRYFLKKILKLPPFTPTYVVMLETGVENSYIYTLDLHLRYIIKTIYEYDSNRLPNQLTKLIMQQGTYWYENVDSLGRDVCSTRISECSTRESWELLRTSIITGLKIKEREFYLDKASNSSRFYSKLNYREPQTYFDITNMTTLSYIFKARCDLIELNGTRFQQNRSRICSLCNLNEIENILHFIARCPILKQIRYQHFKKTTLSENELINILNTKDNFKDLSRYIIYAIRYRKMLINEFNY